MVRAILTGLALAVCASLGVNGAIAQPALNELRAAQTAKLKTLDEEFSRRGNLPGARGNAAYQEHLRQEYSNRASDIRSEALKSDNRGAVIDNTIQAHGYRNPDGTCCQRDPQTGKILGDIENTGSTPKDVRSDVDLNAKTHAAADAVKNSWQGQEVEVSPHKYINRTTDTTVWRPCEGPCMDLKVRDTDAWTTEGGLQGTGNAERIRDPKGFYLDNEKKFIHAQNLVKEGNVSEGLQTAAKSLDKPAVYAGMKPVAAAEISNPVERKFWQQAEGLRAYASPVEVGIADPADSSAVKAEKVAAWLDNAEQRMRTAQQKLTAWGDALDKTRTNIQQSLANSRPADPRNQAMNEVRATSLKAEIDLVRRSNAAVEEFNRQQRGGVAGGATPEPAGRDKAANTADSQVPDHGPILGAAKNLDDRIKASLGITDTGKNLNLPRQRFNEFAENHLPKAEVLLDRIFIAKELYDAGADIGEFMDHFGVAMDSATPDIVANEQFEAAAAVAHRMIVTGTLGAGLGTVLGGMPTVGAVLGSGTLSYQGTRWVLEQTAPGQAVDRAAGRVADAVVGTPESLTDRARRLLGYESGYTRERRAERERASQLLQGYLAAIDDGRLSLRDGQTIDNLIDAISNGEFGRIRAQIVRNGVGPVVAGPPPGAATGNPPVPPGGAPPAGQPGGVTGRAGANPVRPPAVPGGPAGTTPPGAPLGPPTAVAGAPVATPVAPTFDASNGGCRNTAADPRQGPYFSNGPLTGSVGADFSPPCPAGTNANSPSPASAQPPAAQRQAAAVPPQPWGPKDLPPSGQADPPGPGTAIRTPPPEGYRPAVVPPMPPPAAAAAVPLPGPRPNPAVTQPAQPDPRVAARENEASVAAAERRIAEDRERALTLQRERERANLPMSNAAAPPAGRPTTGPAIAPPQNQQVAVAPPQQPLPPEPPTCVVNSGNWRTGQSYARVMVTSSNYACTKDSYKPGPGTRVSGVRVVSPPMHGTVVPQGGGWTYRSSPNYKGADTFSVSVQTNYGPAAFTYNVTVK